MDNYYILLELAIILFSTKAFGILMRKLNLPQVAGALIAGLIIGPCVLNTVRQSDILSALAEIGVVMIMFSAGLESDLKSIKHNGKSALMVALFGVIVPLGLGTLIAAIFGGCQRPERSTLARYSQKHFVLHYCNRFGYRVAFSFQAAFKKVSASQTRTDIRACRLFGLRFLR